MDHKLKTEENIQYYVRLIVKPDIWYKGGSEVFHYDHPRRLTLDEYTYWVQYNMILVRGIREDGELDGESCSLDEFILEITKNDGIKEYQEMVELSKKMKNEVVLDYSI